MEYTIVSGSSEEEIIKMVKELIESGWETEGGIAIDPNGKFFQAMIRFDDEYDEYETGTEL